MFTPSIVVLMMMNTVAASGAAVVDNNGTYSSVLVRNVTTPGYAAAVSVDGTTTASAFGTTR